MPFDVVVAVVLMLLGYLLLFVEVAVIPGFGVIGVLGLGSLGGGCYLLWMAAGPAFGSLGIVLGLAGAIFGVVRFARSRMARSLVLDEEVRGTAAPTEVLEALVGRGAQVASTLRPSGIVTIDGVRRDAVLRHGAFAEAGARVRVVGQEHAQLIVEIEDSDS